MLAKRIILSLLLTGLLLVLYFQRVFVDSPEPDHATAQELIDLFTHEPATVNKISEHVNPVKSNDTENVGRQPESTTASNNLKKINIFGRVVDEYRQPIENVLISEEHFFYYTRSDSDGFYRLALELPKHRLPLLKFLRSGYEGNRFDIASGESGVDSQLELNVTLLESVESIKVNGWIGNETGENLSRQKISIYSRTNQGLKNISRTVISDENGEFVFEAVKPDADYELDVLSSAFIKTARAKGMSERRVVFVHALRNACLSIVTVGGDLTVGLINGAVIVETVFGWPGLGRHGRAARYAPEPSRPCYIEHC